MQTFLTNPLIDNGRGIEKPTKPRRRVSAATSAPGSIGPARLVFTRIAARLIKARSAAVTMLRVAGTNRICSDTTSHDAKKDALLAATVQPSLTAGARESSRAHARTSIPNARA